MDRGAPRDDCPPLSHPGTPTGASVRFGCDRFDAVRVREPGASADRETDYVYDRAGSVVEIHDPLGDSSSGTRVEYALGPGSLGA